MTTAYTNFLAAIDAAGYVHDKDWDVYNTVIELPRKFVFLMTLVSSGQLLVGTFFKASVSGSGDFAACPAYEGDDAAAALAALLAEASAA